MAEVYDGFIPHSHAADFLPLRVRWRVAFGVHTEGVSRAGDAQLGSVEVGCG